MIKKRAFSLLEVMIALALILIASGVTGWKMHQAVCKKRFQSDLQKLEARLWVCHKMALAMQSDWRGTLTRDREGWVFEAVCVDRPEARPLKPLRLHPLDLYFERGKKESMTIDFFASGHVLPEGEWLFLGPSNQRKSFEFPQMFFSESTSASNNPAPVHPLHE